MQNLKVIGQLLNVLWENEISRDFRFKTDFGWICLLIRGPGAMDTRQIARLEYNTHTLLLTALSPGAALTNTVYLSMDK